MIGKLTPREKKAIIAAYAESRNYSQVGRDFHISNNTVKRIVESDSEFSKIVEQKNKQTEADILEFLDNKKKQVCEIIQKGLDALGDEEKFKNAAPAQITTAIGTLIDKFTSVQAAYGSTVEDDPLTKALREEAERINNERNKQ